MDAKYYAGTQTMDEAVTWMFSRYLHDKLEWEWPINPSLKELLDATIKDSRWDFKYLACRSSSKGFDGGLRHLYQLAQEPLLKIYSRRDEDYHGTSLRRALVARLLRGDAGERASRPQDFISTPAS